MSKRNSKKFSWAKRWSWKSFQFFSWQGLTTGFSKCKMKTQLLSRFLTQLSSQNWCELITNVNSHKGCAGHSSCCIWEQFGSVIPVTPPRPAVVCWVITLKPPLHQTSSAHRSQPLLKASDHLGVSALEPLQFIKIPLQLGNPQLHVQC